MELNSLIGMGIVGYVVVSLVVTVAMCRIFQVVAHEKGAVAAGEHPARQNASSAAQRVLPTAARPVRTKRVRKGSTRRRVAAR
jgi:hypothetical protein